MELPPLTPRALRTRWAVARLQRLAGRIEGSDGGSGLLGPVTAMGLSFASPIGLAAGFDRCGRLLEGGHRLGLGAVEIGTLTNADRRPALPRRTAHGARCGVSIGKPRHVDWDDAAEHAWLRSLRAFHAGADYVTLNPGRDCPSPARFAALAAAAVQLRNRLARHRRPLPLLVKLTSQWLDGDAAAVIGVAAAFVAAGIDGLLVSTEGADARRKACTILSVLSRALDPRVCLISVGGIDSVDEAEARLAAGATLVQLHRALLAHDPRLLRALRGRTRSR